MNLQEYTPEIYELSVEIQRCLDCRNERVFPLLKELQDIAEKRRDHRLMGYVYHNLAGAYYDHNDHDRVFDCLQKALFALFRSDEREYIGRSYNLFAMEAQRYGSLSIAYRYYSLAAEFFQDIDAPILRAVIHSNAADLLNDLGSPKLALGYIERAIPLFQRAESEGLGMQLTLSTISLAVLHVLNGNMDKAKEAQGEVERLVKEHGYERDPIVSNWLSLMDAHIAVVDGTAEQARDCTTQIINRVVKHPLAMIFLKDVCRYGQLLAEHGYWQLLDELIEAIDQHMPAQTPPYVLIMFAQLKIRYFAEIVQQDCLMETYAERSRLLAEQQVFEDRITYESIRLLRIVDELQAELNGIRRENARLQAVAATARDTDR